MLVERERDEPRLVDGVSLTPAFAPGGSTDGDVPSTATLRFRITRDEPAAEVEVVDVRGEVVSTLASGRSLGDYDFHTFEWDGRTEAGELAPPGEYGFVVRLITLERTLRLGERTTLRRVAPPAPSAAEAER